jgi:hypothetical protein
LEAELTRQLDRIAGLLVRLVDKMPDGEFGFRPAQGTRTFAAAVVHAAQTDLNICSTLLQRRHALSGKSLETTVVNKVDALATIRAAVAFCAEYTSALKPGDLADRFFEGSGTREGNAVTIRTPHAGMLANLIAHNNEMYGYLAVYLRLKGIVPPTSES